MHLISKQRTIKFVSTTIYKILCKSTAQDIATRKSKTSANKIKTE